MLQRLSLREGWTTFWLAALVVFTATWSVQSADWADGLGILTVVTIAGLAVGLILANVDRIPPVVAHLVALALGAVVVLYEMTGFLSDNLGGRQEKLRYLWTRWELWFNAVRRGERADDLYLFILLMAALLWVLSYASIWFIFRSHWIWLSLLLPGVVLLLNMGYSDRVPSVLVLVYLFAAILLLMRFTFAEREQKWQRVGVPYPDTLTWRGFWVASYLGLAVILTGWVLPLSTQSQAILQTWDRVNGPWRQVEDTFNTWFSSLRGPGGVGVGGFASFGDRFQLGGPLRLNSDPVLLVKGDSAPYLAAHTYDVFTGSGWQSDVGQTFQPQGGSSGGQVSPLIEFKSGQAIPTPASVSQARTEQKYTVQVYSPRGAVLFSSGEATGYSVPVQVQLAWYTYTNQRIDIQTATEADTPPELWPLVQLLQKAEFHQFVPPSEAATPAATPEAAATPVATPTPVPEDAILFDDWAGDPLQVSDIQAEFRTLRQRGIRIRYGGMSPSGDAFKMSYLTFSGQLPVYSDVEAIFARDGVRSGDQYQFTSLSPDATPDQLRQASTDYPTEITSRYLQLPEVSARTKALTEQLARGKSNPYDIATAIEAYLRTNLKYNENVPNPPANRDLVDYFLFDIKQGYCVYYASAMAEMLRVLGIPTRVVVGFYPAQYDSNAGGYLYRNNNAHSWPEAYFPGYGWIPFEPTAARAEIQRGPAPSSTPATGQNGAPSGGASSENGLGRFNEDFPPDAGLGGTVTVSTPPNQGLTWVLRIILGLAIVVTGAVSFLWLRGTRGMSPVTQFFTKTQRGANWSGLRANPSMTPYEFAASISKQIPGSRTHLDFLANLYVRETYGRQESSSSELHRARTAWLRIRGLLVRYLLIGRWRARVGRHDLGEE